MNVMDRDIDSLMPPLSPLSRATQNLDRPFLDSNAPPLRFESTVLFWRFGAFFPALLATLGLFLTILGWFDSGGYSSIEVLLITLISFNFFWISFSVSTVLTGIISLYGRVSPVAPSPTDTIESLDVALLLPICNETPWYVLGNACAILDELSDARHRYTMFVLSDTGDQSIASQELLAVRHLRADGRPNNFYYRRRIENVDKKVGNISDWVEHWGGSYPAMIILDADSLMSGSAIVELTDSLSGDSCAGLIQSFPQLIGSNTVFARAQQFASGVYGSVLAEGIAKWSGHEGNYWGHNAILRTRAFADCAGLPKVRSLHHGESLIKSHDFVEAGLLRRAGWGVRFLPRVRGSYEETPGHLIDHISRDRRWCEGNLQHLRLLGSRGFHLMSRFHLFHGAMSYLLSPVWFCLLVVWALIGNGPDASVLTYFTPNNPLFPVWPEMNGGHLLILLLMYAMLLAPKFLGVASLSAMGVKMRHLGGTHNFLVSFMLEIILSIAYAPILMVQQMISVFRTLLGYDEGWKPQARLGGRYRLRTLIRCHILETISGICLLVGLFSGLITLWLLPIALSLSLSIPLSALSGLNLSRFGWSALATPESYDEPPIMRSARGYRERLRVYLEDISAAPAE